MAKQDKTEMVSTSQADKDMEQLKEDMKNEWWKASAIDDYNL